MAIKRRNFLKLSSTAIVAGMTGKVFGHKTQEGDSMIEEAARKVGRLPRRKLGYSNRDISFLIGAGDMDNLANREIMCRCEGDCVSSRCFTNITNSFTFLTE